MPSHCPRDALSVLSCRTVTLLVLAATVLLPVTAQEPPASLPPAAVQPEAPAQPPGPTPPTAEAKESQAPAEEKATEKKALPSPAEPGEELPATETQPEGKQGPPEAEAALTPAEEALPTGATPEQVAAPRPDRRRIEQSLESLQRSTGRAAGSRARRHWAQELLRRAQLGLAATRTELSKAALRVTELKSEQTKLRREQMSYPRAVVDGARSLEQARAEIKRLAQEQERYDGLYDEVCSARDQAQNRATDYAQGAARARAQLAPYARDRTIQQALRKLDERAALAAKLRDEWQEAVQWSSRNAELAAEVIAGIQEAVATAPQRKLLYRTDVRPSVTALRTALADMASLFAVAGGAPEMEERTAAAGWFWDLILLAGAAVGALLILFVLGQWAERQFLAALSSEQQLAPQALSLRDRALLLLLKRSLVLAAVFGTSRLAELPSEAEQFWVALAAAWLGYATLVQILRLIPDSAWERNEDRAAWHRVRRWVNVLAAVCAVFLPVIGGLKWSSYEHGNVVVLLEAVFGLLAALAVLFTFGRAGAVALLRGRSEAWAQWLVARAATVRALVVLLALALVGLHVLGWANLARYFGRALPSTLLLLGLVGVAGGQMRAWARRDPQPDREADAEYWQRRAMAVGAVLVYVLGALIILWVWGVRVHHVNRLLAAMAAPVLSVKGAKVSVTSILRGLIIGIIVILIGRLVRGWLERARFMSRLDQGARYAISTTVYYLIITGAVLGAVMSAGFELSVLTIFAGVAGIAVGFGSQDIAKNFISGIIILLDRSVNVGDYIKVGGTEGTITDINIRCTTLHTPDNNMVIVPNANLVAQQLVSATLGDPKVRLTLDVAVVADSDPDLVTDILQTAAQAHPYVMADPAPEVWMSKLAAASLNFQLVVWTEKVDAQAQITGELTTRIWRDLRAKEIKLV